MRAGNFTAGFLATLLVAATAAGAVKAEQLTFLAIGDLPYTEKDQIGLKNKVLPTLRGRTEPFIVHYGDFKSGGSDCDNSRVDPSIAAIKRDFPGHFFYTPGDNEWTDCDRSNLSNPKSELEQLFLLRRTYFGNTVMDGGWFVRQKLYPENVRWHWPKSAATGGILFSTLHIVGTNNGRRQILLDDNPWAISRVEARDNANRVWLAAMLEDAKTRKPAAMVVVTQANLEKRKGRPACTATNGDDCDSNLEIRNQLIQTAKSFGGPMLVIHGSTNAYCWDKSFGGSGAPNLWRLDGTGDFQSATGHGQIADLNVVSVDTGNKAEPFKSVSMIYNLAPAAKCPN